MENTTNAIKTNANIIEEITAETVKIAFGESDVQAVTVTTDIELTTPTDAESKAFFDAIRKAAGKAVAKHHIKLYNNDVFRAIANSKYTCTFGEKDFTLVIPAMSVMNAEAKAAYNESVAYIQKFYAEYLNSATNGNINPSVKTKMRKKIKVRCQEVSDLFKTNSKDPANLYMNDRDMEILFGGLLKCKNHMFSTAGDKAVMKFIEAMFYHKLIEKEYFVTLFTSNKALNGVKEKVVESEAAGDEIEAA